MKIHEYQAKDVLKGYGVSVPNGILCTSPEEVGKATETLQTPVVVVKAQIHAGGRGKGGGVRVVRGSEEAVEAAKSMMARNLITHQTGPEGQPVRRIWVEEGCAIADELYIGITMDRKLQCPVIMASSEGGMEIEEVAAKTPEKILREPLDPEIGLRGFQARRLAKGIGIPSELINSAIKFFGSLCDAFLANDCSLAEVNPLVVTEDSKLIALDAKMNFDDNALFRHSSIAELRDMDEEDAAEVEAAESGLSYISLDGNIGCLVNGAGLAMATMDLIQLHGGEPANFLDVGGGANAQQVAHAFKIILGDENVKGILVNIFGGILSCKTLADGICQAVKEVELHVPLVVRLEGTEVADGRQILEESGLPITTATDMTDAANKIVGLVS